MATRKAVSDELDFDSLLASAELEVRKSGTKDRYLPADQVKDSVSAAVKTLYTTKKRLPLKVSSKAQYDQIHGQFASAAHHQGFSANIRSVYSGEGEDAKLVGVTITVTDKRAPKKTGDATETGD